MKQTSLPVAIIGAGPVGLAAAAHLIRSGESPLLLEAGDTVGSAVLEWGHVRLFSPWRYLIDQAAASLLEEQGWSPPDSDGYPTGRSLVESYLLPLSQVPQIQEALRLNTRVLSVSRLSLDKMKTAGRSEAPFVLRVLTADGEERDLLARAVIDASGTFATPNPLGAHGLLARGEQTVKEHIFYGIPEVLGQHRERYAGRRVLVVGSGHSAFNVVLELAQLAEQNASTHILWAIRREQVGQMFGGGESDALPARGQLGLHIHDLIESERVRLFTGVQIQALCATDKGVVIEGEEGRIGPVDEIIATTGFRPDLDMVRELRLALDSSLESPVELAPLIDPNVHSCGTVPPHGVDELSHPEQNFYIVGMKSYGRAPTFLMLTGYEQVRSIVAALCGEWEAARSVELVLPETGVCSTDAGGSCGLPGADATSCCSPAATPLLTVGVTRRSATLQKR
jgi:thioredoxin reductase